MNAAAHAYLPSFSGKVIAAAPGVASAKEWGVRPMYRARAAALSEGCSHVQCIVPHLHLAILAPGSLRENNEQWSNKVAVTPTREVCHGPRIARQACDRNRRQSGHRQG